MAKFRRIRASASRRIFRPGCFFGDRERHEKARPKAVSLCGSTDSSCDHSSALNGLGFEHDLGYRVTYNHAHSSSGTDVFQATTSSNDRTCMESPPPLRTAQQVSISPRSVRLPIYHPTLITVPSSSSQPRPMYASQDIQQRASAMTVDRIAFETDMAKIMCDIADDARDVHALRNRLQDEEQVLWLTRQKFQDVLIRAKKYYAEDVEALKHHQTVSRHACVQTCEECATLRSRVPGWLYKTTDQIEHDLIEDVYRRADIAADFDLHEAGQASLRVTLHPEHPERTIHQQSRLKQGCNKRLWLRDDSDDSSDGSSTTSSIQEVLTDATASDKLETARTGDSRCLKQPIPLSQAKRLPPVHTTSSKIDLAHRHSVHGIYDNASLPQPLQEPTILACPPATRSQRPLSMHAPSSTNVPQVANAARRIIPRETPVRLAYLPQRPAPPGKSYRVLVHGTCPQEHQVVNQHRVGPIYTNRVEPDLGYFNAKDAPEVPPLPPKYRKEAGAVRQRSHSVAAIRKALYVANPDSGIASEEDEPPISPPLSTHIRPMGAVKQRSHSIAAAPSGMTPSVQPPRSLQMQECSPLI